MPKLKRPRALRFLSLFSLVGLSTQHCFRAIADERFDDLREIVSTIRRYICNSLPPRYVQTFGTEFLIFIDALSTVMKVKDYPNKNHKALLEVLMDRPMHELKLSYELVLLRSLDPGDAYRFLELKKLDLSHIQEHGVPSLPIIRIEDFCLKDLTHFVSQPDITDSELKIIADNCPKLESLKFEWTTEITDEGLLNLRQCKRLRSLDVSKCELVNWNAISRLIKTHDVIETLFCLIFFAPDFSLSEYAKYPTLRSIKRLEIREDFVFRTDHLQFLVTKFPNLNFLYIAGHFTGGLSPLTRLSKLEKLELTYDECSGLHAPNPRVEGCVLHGFLKSVGDNLSHLYLSRGNELSIKEVQADINVLFLYCKNLANLHFHWPSNEALTQLIVPSFKKLKSLCCAEFDIIETEGPYLEMRFDQMPALVSLSLYGYKMRMTDLKSIINDHEKFPELASINLGHITDDEIAEINQITREKNLALSIDKFRCTLKNQCDDF